MTHDEITRTASDHLLHSTPATFALDAAFVRDMEQHRAEVAGRVVRRLEQEEITNAVKQEIRERMALNAADIADMQARCDETASQSPSYDGMWM